MLKPNQQNSIFISASYCALIKIGKKSWRIVVIHQIRQRFFPSKVFYCTVNHLIVEIKAYTEHHNCNSQLKLTNYTINIIAENQFNS